jgi:hypothetical protein
MSPSSRRRVPIGTRPSSGQSRASDESSKAFRVSVVVAVIGAVATIIAAAIGLFKQSEPPHPERTPPEIARAIIQMTAISYKSKPPPPAINVSGLVLNPDDPGFRDEIIYVIARPASSPTKGNSTAPPGAGPNAAWYVSEPAPLRSDHSWVATILINDDVDGPLVVQTVAVPKCALVGCGVPPPAPRSPSRGEEPTAGQPGTGPVGYFSYCSGSVTYCSAPVSNGPIFRPAPDSVVINPPPEPPPNPPPDTIRDVVIQNGNKVADYTSNTQTVTPTR